MIALLRVVAGRHGARGHDDGVGGMGIGDEQLGSVDDVAVAGRAGGGLDAPGLGGGRRLGERQGETDGAGANAAQNVSLLLVAAGVQHGQAAQHDGGEERRGQQGASHLLDQHGQVQERAAGAAILFGERYAGPAQVGHLTPQVFAVALRVVFQRTHQRERAFLGQKFAGRVLQHLLNLAESHIHREKPPAAAHTNRSAGRSKRL